MLHQFAALLLAATLPTGIEGRAESDDSAPTVSGRVFLDRNADRHRDPGEPGLPGVRVSNGREVAITDSQGRYVLPIDDDEIIFLTDGSTEDFVDGDATEEEIVDAFAYLSANVALNDKVSLILGDNGAFGGGDSYLITSDEVLISKTEIASMVNDIAAENIAIVVSFDYSGGFLDVLSGNGRLVLTSHAIEATTTNNYNIADGLTEEDADTNCDGKVSFEEAHIWVAEQISDQSPQMSDGIFGEFTL